MPEIIILLVLFGFSCYVWFTEKDKLELYYVWLYGIGTLMLIWGYIAKNLLQLSGGASLMNRYFALVVWLLIGVAWLFVTLKSLKRKFSKRKRS